MSKTYLEIDYELYDTSAIEDSTYTGSKIDNGLSDLVLLTSDAKYDKYTTFEHNFSVLDGSCTAMPDDAKIPYFSSDMADDTGMYNSIYPGITNTFTGKHSSIGITLHFLDAYPNKVRIEWYDIDGNLIDTKDYVVTSLDFFCKNLVQDYAKVVISILEANPFSYPKIRYVEYGCIYVWGEEDIKEGTANTQVSMLSDSLSVSKLTFQLIDENNDFNIGNTTGLHVLLQKGQVANAYEWINGTKNYYGKWFFNTNSTSKNITKIAMQDYIGMLDTAQFIDGEVYTGMEAGIIIDSIMRACGITDYIVDLETAVIKLYGSLKPQTCRNALKEVLFAADSIVVTSRSDKLIIKKRERLIQKTVARTRKFSTEMTKDDYISDVTVKFTDYFLDSTVSKISSAAYVAGTYTVQFTVPYKDITATASTGTVTIIKQSYFYVTFTVSDESTVTLNGYKYATSNVSASATISKIAAGTVRKTKSFTGTMMDFRLAQAKAEAILNYYQLRHKLKIKCLGDMEDCGNWLEIENPVKENGNFIAGAEQIDTDLSGGFIESITMHGYYKLTSDDYYVSDLPELYANEDIGIL